jgi:hypothetical protein
MAMEKQENKSFNRRALVSVAMIASGTSLPISGIMNHLLQFEPFTIARHFWMSVHNMSAILFSVFVIFHLTYNWSVLVKHLRKVKGIRISKEAVIAIILVAGIVGLFSLHTFI